MPERLPERTQSPPEQAWRTHFIACPVCLEAASFRQACEAGRRLHEEWVLSAHAVTLAARRQP